MSWKNRIFFIPTGFFLLFFHFIPATQCEESYKKEEIARGEKILRVLSIDGGGVRGIIPARILEEIENRTHKPISELFDLIVGNSTGGLLALGLTVQDDQSKPKYSANDILRLYLERSKDIFSRSIWRKMSTGNGLWGAKYSREALDSILDKLFGNTLLSQTIKPVLIISYSLTQGEPSFWTTYFSREHPSKDAYLKDIAGATTAAPTYFPPKELKNKEGTVLHEADGGIYANNPSSIALAKVYAANPKIKKENILLISIGTGKIKLDKAASELKDAGIIGWVMQANLIDVMMAASNYLQEWEASILSNALTKRIQVNIPENLGQMDNTTDENLKGLLHKTEQYIKDNDDKIKEICDILLASN